MFYIVCCSGTRTPKLKGRRKQRQHLANIWPALLAAKNIAALVSDVKNVGEILANTLSNMLDNVGLANI